MAHCELSRVSECFEKTKDAASKSFRVMKRRMFERAQHTDWVPRLRGFIRRLRLSTLSKDEIISCLVKAGYDGKLKNQTFMCTRRWLQGSVAQEMYSG